MTGHKVRPSRSPQTIRGNPNAWYYEDRRGITVVAEVRDKDGKYLGQTLQTRILWSALQKSAGRCDAAIRTSSKPQDFPVGVSKS